MKYDAPGRIDIDLRPSTTYILPAHTQAWSPPLFGVWTCGLSLLLLSFPPFLINKLPPPTQGVVSIHPPIRPRPSLLPTYRQRRPPPRHSPPPPSLPHPLTTISYGRSRAVSFSSASRLRISTSAPNRSMALAPWVFGMDGDSIERPVKWVNQYIKIPVSADDEKSANKSPRRPRRRGLHIYVYMYLSSKYRRRLLHIYMYILSTYRSITRRTTCGSALA